MGKLIEDLNEEVGEEGTGFTENDGRGDFRCGNCVHMKDGVCVHPVMVKKNRKNPRKDGYPKVEPRDCCRFVRRPGD